MYIRKLILKILENIIYNVKIDKYLQIIKKILYLKSTKKNRRDKYVK